MKRFPLSLAVACSLAALLFTGCQIAEPTHVRSAPSTPVSTGSTMVEPTDGGDFGDNAILAESAINGVDASEVIFDSDQLRVIKSLVQSAPVGGEALIRILLEAKQSIEGVRVKETLPAGLEFVSAAPAGSIRGKTITWIYESMAAGQTETIDITVKPVAEGDQLACTVVTVDNSLCLPFFTGEAKLAVVKDGPDQIEINEEGTWTVTVTNNGSAAATNVVVTDTLPDTLQATSELRHELGTIEPGETKTAQFTAIALEQGQIENRATVTHDADPDGTTATSNPVMAVLSGLKITSSGPEQAYVFKPEPYTITVTNTGDTDLANVRITDLLPAGMTVTDNGNGRVTDNAIGWMIPTLPAGASQIINTELASTQPGMKTVTTKGISANGIEAESSVTTEWQAVPGVTMAFTDSKDPIRVNEETVYQIRVINQGEFKPVGASLELSFSEQLTPVRITGDAEGSINGQVATFPNIRLEPGKDVSISITATGAQIGPGNVILKAKADFLVRPITREETTNVY